MNDRTLQKGVGRTFETSQGGLALPQRSREDLVGAMIREPENIAIRLDYARGLRAAGHADFADVIQMHIELERRIGTLPLEEDLLAQDFEELKMKFERARASYFLPPAAGEGTPLSAWDNTLEGGLQRETILAGHLFQGHFYLEHKRTAFLCKELTPFEPHEEALGYQPFCGFSLYRGIRELDILGERGLLRFVSQIEINERDDFDHAALVKRVASLGTRLQHLYLFNNRDQREILTYLESSSPTPLRSLVLCNTSQSGTLSDLLRPRLRQSLSELIVFDFGPAELSQITREGAPFQSLRSISIRCAASEIDECRRLIESSRETFPALQSISYHSRKV